MEIHSRNIISGYFDLCNEPFEVGGASPSPNVLLPASIDTAPDGGTLAEPASDEIEPACSSQSKKNSKTAPERSNNRLKKSMVHTRSDFAKACSDDVPIIELESDCE